MLYVYVIQSIASPEHHYTGITDDLNQRLREHNDGESRHTSKYKLWKFVVEVRFADKAMAHVFEKYLNSGSGRAFMKRYFL